LTFQTVIQGTEFTNFAAVFKDYKIQSISAIVNPLSVVYTSAIHFPLLHLNVDSETSTALANPTNNVFILGDRNHFFSPMSTAIKAVTFRLPKSSAQSTLWRSTADNPVGCLYIGNYYSAGQFGAGTTSIFEMYVSFLIEFSNPK